MSSSGSWGIFCKEFPAQSKEITRLGIVIYQAGSEDALQLPEYHEILQVFMDLPERARKILGIPECPLDKEVLTKIFTLGTAMLLNLENS